MKLKKKHGNQQFKKKMLSEMNQKLLVKEESLKRYCVKTKQLDKTGRSKTTKNNSINN